jgi:hypothetical protein
VFYVKDASWGGILAGTDTLSPTSTAMVESSDQFVAIGGGEVSRDEALAGERAGKRVRFFPADMNHKIALERAARRKEPAPKDFSGPLAAEFAARKK